VVGRDADVRRALLDHLRAPSAARRPRADGRSCPCEAAQAVEVAEQLVGAVDQVDDHRGFSPARRTAAYECYRYRRRQALQLPRGRIPVAASASTDERLGTLHAAGPSAPSSGASAGTSRHGWRRPPHPAARPRCSPTCGSCNTHPSNNDVLESSPRACAIARPRCSTSNTATTSGR
jgi:hypothetical protein